MAEINGTDDSETIEGTPEDDQIHTSNGDDIVHGDAGDDWINARQIGDFVSFTAYYSGSLIAYGGPGDDLIGGKDDNDRLYGGIGNDWLNGREGDDSLFGNDGDDHLIGGEGHDFLRGGIGDDKLEGNAGSDHLVGGQGDDYILTGDGDDYAYGNEGDDWINAEIRIFFGFVAPTYSLTQGNLRAWGGPGDDRIGGKTGDDRLYGGDGDDVIYGDDGDDILDGGPGADELNGGDGDDSYYIDDLNDHIDEDSGHDTAYVSVSYKKIPLSIEVVEYINGARPLPYWISALLRGSDEASTWPGLLGDAKTFYYAFPAEVPAYLTSKFVSGIDADGYKPLSAQQQINAIYLLEYLEDIIDVNVEPTNDPDQPNTILVALNNQSSTSGYSNYPEKYSDGSDIFLNASLYQDSSMGPGTRAASTLVHELGHALGLKHPFEQAPGSYYNDPPYLQGSEDDGSWTMMSYNRDAEQYKLSFSELDIAALQYLYGPSRKARTGDDTYHYDASAPNFIWDGAGVDTIDASQSLDSVTIFLEHGRHGYNSATGKSEWITAPGQITVNFGTEIENLTGSEQGDTLTGNHLNNAIQGLGGADEIFGGEGDDQLDGGPGDDIIDGGSGNDRLLGGEGVNTLLGGSGLDYAVFAGQRNDFLVLAAEDGITVTLEASPETAQNNLETIERLAFQDIHLAFDFDGNAGIAAKVLGAFLGAGGLGNASLAGYVLDLLDTGMSYDDLLQTAVDTVFGPDPTGAEIAAHFATSLTGDETPNAVIAGWAARFDAGEITAAEFARLAAEDDLNLANIDFVGLAASGLEYLPA